MRLRLVFIAWSLAAALTGLPVYAADAETNSQKEAATTKLLVEKLGKDAETIRVTVVGDKTTLTGEVTQRATQELADEVLKYAGATKIDNQVKARNEKGLFSGKATQETADTKIEMDVRSKVKGEVGDHYKNVYIECTGSTCSVRGTLPDQSRKDLALKAAAGVPGVKHVVDLLRIK